MAGAGSSDTSQARDRSYLGALTGRFIGRYGTWRQEDHAPMTREEYAANRERSQTAICARVAASHYQMMVKDVNLSHITGIDSHVFERRWLVPDDTWLCFHVNFRALVDGEREFSFFFAELIGTNSPQMVTVCVRLRSKLDYSVKNCTMCTGLWHPVGGNFLGYTSDMVAAPAGLVPNQRGHPTMQIR